MLYTDEIDKYIRTGVTLGQVPAAGDTDSVLVCDISYEQVLCGFVKAGTITAVQTFPLFKVSDDSTLDAVFKHIIQNKLGYTTIPGNMQLASWQWPFTSVPASFFSEEMAADFLKFQFVNLPVFEPRYDTITNETLMLYALPGQWKGFDMAHVQHTYAAVAKTLLASENGKEATVWAYIHAQSLALFYINDNQLIFCNAFTPLTQQDYVYYIMLLYNQLKLNASNVPLKFMGEVQPQSALCEAMSRYVRYVQFAEYVPGIELDIAIAAQPAHYYFGLYALAECVLSMAH